MSAETLLPCPFCGGVAKMGLTARVEWKDTVSVFCVHCSANVCRTGPVQSEAAKRQVNEAWNRRTPQPDALPGDLRERVTQIIEAAIERHNPGNSLRHTVDDADAILALIQSERGGA